MTKSEILDIYRKQRKAFRQRKYYYKKKYGIELVTPRLVKNPTEKTLERFAKNVYKQTQQAKRVARHSRFVPTAEEILLNRIYAIIAEGLNTGNPFPVYKANRVDQLIQEALPSDRRRKIEVLKEWERRLPDIDYQVERFIFDSEQTDFSVTGRKSTAVWNTLSSVILGVRAEFIEYFDFAEDGEENEEDEL